MEEREMMPVMGMEKSGQGKSSEGEGGRGSESEAGSSHPR